MRTLRRFFSDTGFSLAEISISMGILGAVSLVTMKIVQDQSGQDAIARYKTEVNLKSNELETMLNKTDKCSNILFNKMIAPAPAGVTLGAGAKLTYTDPDLGRAKDIIEVKTYPHFNVASITLYTNTISDQSFDVEVVFTPKSGLERLAAFFGSSRSTIRKRITVVGTVTANQIKSCGPVVSNFYITAKKYVCDQLNLQYGAAAQYQFTWNPGPSTCTPRAAAPGTQCPAGQVPTGISRFGRYTCSVIQNQVNFNLIFDPTPTVCPTKRFALYVDSTTNKIQMGCADTLTPAQKAYTYTYPYP